MHTIHNLSLEPTIYDTRSIHNLFTWKTEMNFLKCLHLFYNPMHLFSGNNTKFGSIFQLPKKECEKQTHSFFLFYLTCFYILRYKCMANKWKWILSGTKLTYTSKLRRNGQERNLKTTNRDDFDFPIYM